MAFAEEQRADAVAGDAVVVAVVGEWVVRVAVLAQAQAVRVVQHEQEVLVVAPASPPQVVRAVLVALVRHAYRGESIARGL